MCQVPRHACDLGVDGLCGCGVWRYPLGCCGYSFAVLRRWLERGIAALNTSAGCYVPAAA